MLALSKIFAVKNVNISLTLSTLLHLGIFGLLAWKTSEAVTAVPQQQIIMVELVAMEASMPALRTEVIPAPKPFTTPKAKNPELLIKKQEKPKPEKQVEDTQENKSTHSASGEVQSNDDQTQNAALTEPVFNAAYLKNPPPVYPQAAKRQNIEGEVLLKVEVSEEGRAENVRIDRSSGSSILDYAAISAVKRWKFIPAKQDGNTVVASVVVPIVFRIEG